MKNIRTIFSLGYMYFPENYEIADDAVISQDEFDNLAVMLFNEGITAAIKAADAIDKISLRQPFYLTRYKNELIALATLIENDELKSRLAKLLPRLCLTASELNFVWKVLFNWAAGAQNCVSVRRSALMGMNDLKRLAPEGSGTAFYRLLLNIERENCPVLQACVGELKTAMLNY